MDNASNVVPRLGLLGSGLELGLWLASKLGLESGPWTGNNVCRKLVSVQNDVDLAWLSLCTSIVKGAIQFSRSPVIDEERMRPGWVWRFDFASMVVRCWLVR